MSATTLKDRIAALQANSGLAPSAASSRSPSPALSTLSDSAGSNAAAKEIPKGTRLRDKIARFDRIGGAPVPRGSFGLGAPSASSNSGPKDFYGNTSDRPHAQRSASLRVPRTVDPDGVFGPAAEKPFDTVGPRSRSGSSYSNMSNGTSPSARPSYLSPNYTGDSGSYFSRSASLRSVSPNPPSEPYSTRASPLSSPRRALTADALANLPSSPSFRPSDITSSVATDLDVESERTNLATAPGAFRGPATNNSSTNLTSPTSTVPSSTEGDLLGRGRAETLTTETPSGADSAPSSAPPSASSRPSREGSPTSDAPLLGARPTTPSYLAQAASYFPPSKRQSVHLPAMPIFAEPSTSDPPSTSNNVNSQTTSSAANSPPSKPSTIPTATTPSSYRPKSSGGRKSAISASAFDDIGSESRASTDTAFFTAENESFSSNGVSTEALRRRMEDLTVRVPSQSQLGATDKKESERKGDSARVPPTPIPSAMLDAFPSPPPSTRLSPSKSGSPSPALVVKSPASPPQNATVSSTRLANDAATTSRPAAPAPRKKKPILIPGKWINSDDEDEEEDEPETKGWARIIVASSAR